jgi:hypothetical protein
MSHVLSSVTHPVIPKTASGLLMFDTEHTVVVKVRSCNLKLWHKLRIVPEFSRTSRASSRYKLLKLERPEDLPSGLKAATSWKYFRMIQRAMSIGDSSSRTRKSRTLLSLVKRCRAVDKSLLHSKPQAPANRQRKLALSPGYVNYPDASPGLVFPVMGLLPVCPSFGQGDCWRQPAHKSRD